jgi:hypothetical protein
MKTKYYLLIIIIPAVISASANYASAQKRCDYCDRHGMLVEFLNPHNPDYEERLKEWNDCMKRHLGDATYLGIDTLDPKYTNAVESCSELDPPDKWYCYPEIVSVYMGERFTSPCFHLLSPIFYAPGTDKPPEYIFKGSYEANIEGGRIIEYDEDYKKPVIAKMELRLYYNGNSPELVTEWSSENTINDPRALFNKMKTPKSLNPIFEEFEIKPVSIDVEVPSQEEICEKGNAEIVLSGFKDAAGNPSREFNRIVVSIFRGKILNGADSDFGPDYKVFTVGNGEVRVKYQPPEDKDDGYEWLRVYNSCEILPEEKFPLSRTQPDELIVDQHFPIFCGFYQGTITIEKKWDFTEDYGKSSTRNVGRQIVSFNGIFKPIPQMEEMEGQPITIFGPHNVEGTWSYNEDRYCSGDCDCQGLYYQEYGSGNVSRESLQGLIIITNIFPVENKLVDARLDQFGLENWYDIATPTENVSTLCRTKHYVKDAGCQWSSSTSSTNLTGSDTRFKLKDINHLKGNISWSSSKETTGISITDLTEAIYEQKPFDPEQDGTDYHYTVTWNLKAY